MPSQTVYLTDKQSREVQNRIENGEFDNPSKAIQHAVDEVFLASDNTGMSEEGVDNS